MKAEVLLEQINTCPKFNKENENNFKSSSCEFHSERILGMFRQNVFVLGRFQFFQDVRA